LAKARSRHRSASGELVASVDGRKTNGHRVHIEGVDELIWVSNGRADINDKAGRTNDVNGVSNRAEFNSTASGDCSDTASSTSANGNEVSGSDLNNIRVWATLVIYKLWHNIFFLLVFNCD
jgi:hypothetical protein